MFFDCIFKENNLDDRIYQKHTGELYVKSEEVVESKKFQELLDRFTKHIEVKDE